MESIEFHNRKFKKFSYLLAATYPHVAEMTGLDWRPFKDGDTLYDLMETHNDKCIKYYEKQGWMPEDVENEVTILKALIDTLSTVDQLRRSQFERIQFFLIDLDAVQKEKSALLKIRTQMARRINYIMPVNSTITPEWLKDFFLTYTCLHKALPDQEAFESFLKQFSQIEEKALIGLRENAPSGGGDPMLNAAKETYLDALPGVSAEVRDAAMVEHLSTGDSVSLASNAATQERILSHISEQIRPEPGYQVNLSPIRQPIIDLAKKYEEEPELQQTRLLKTTPTRSLSELPQEQRETLASIGIKETNSVVVHHDEPSAREVINSLGDMVKTDAFSAELARW